ncbi:unannotated protein [freshwater metagenome]|uniref:Unannotated protein n=1 Tax=freshwater metagenome TaxID=449393 RepID=A0A6J6A7C9_9ZZZZ
MHPVVGEIAIPRHLEREVEVAWIAAHQSQEVLRTFRLRLVPVFVPATHQAIREVGFRSGRGHAVLRCLGRAPARRSRATRIPLPNAVAFPIVIPLPPIVVRTQPVRVAERAGVSRAVQVWRPGTTNQRINTDEYTHGGVVVAVVEVGEAGGVVWLAEEAVVGPGERHSVAVIAIRQVALPRWRCRDHADGRGGGRLADG